MDKIFDAAAIIQYVPELLDAFPVTIIMLLASLFFGLLAGFLLTLLRSKRKAAGIVKVYISFMRGTPPLVQLFLVYYGLPHILSFVGIEINSWGKCVFAVITFSLNGAAFFSELMRSAYFAVDVGQREAAYSVGMNGFQAFIRILFPQAFWFALPNLGNNIILLLKETSLAFTIGVSDIMGQAQIINARGFGVRQIETYIAVSLIYWGTCILIEYMLCFIENLGKKGYLGLAK